MGGRNSGQCPKREQWGWEAQKLYVDFGLTIKAISERIPVSKNQLRRWKDWEGWEEKRKVYTQGPREMTRTLWAKLSEQLEILKKREGVTKGEADALAELYNIIEKLDRRSMYPSFFLIFIEELTNFLRTDEISKKYPNLLIEIGEILPEFSKVTWAKYRLLI